MAGISKKEMRRSTRSCPNKFCCLILLVVVVICMIFKRLKEISPRQRRPRDSGGSRGVVPTAKVARDAATTKRPEIRQGGAGSNDVRLKGNCLGPTRPDTLLDDKRKKLHKDLVNETQAWGYFKEHEHHWSAFKGMRVLDVGMGQGPICIVAVETGITSYTGLDPALCIDQRAVTRHKMLKHVAGRHSCKAILKGPDCIELGKQCPAYLECWKTADSKYQLFPYTAMEMMAAYENDKVTLLPGTFETLKGTDWLRKGMFDVATLWSVTEHLPNNRLVLEGIYRYLEPGKILRISHHNFYSYDGHHEVPKTPADFDPDNLAHTQLANWQHLENGSFVQNKSSLNRVRLGDLMATVDVYFQCAWIGVPTKGSLAALNDKVFKPLQTRGFHMSELLVSRWHAACVRRNEPLTAPWMSRVIWHHPPLDGSYKAQPIPKKIHQSLVRDLKKTAEYMPAELKELNLKKYLPKS